MDSRAAAPKKYAKMSWSPEDVLTLAPGLSFDEAAEWLEKNQHHITNRLCELGWDVLETLLGMDGISLEGDE